MPGITIIVIDDHPFFRQGVIDCFSLEPDLLLVGQASTGEDGLKLIHRLEPDVAVVDVNLPGMSGQQVVRQVIAARIPTKLVVISSYDDRDQVWHSLRGGAAAFCTKDIMPEQLVDVVRGVMQGKYYIGTQEMTGCALESWLIENSAAAPGSRSVSGEAAYSISTRELEVLALIARGCSNKEIARSLGISHQTVKNHVTAILGKLGMDDRTNAALFAVRNGWVKL